MVGSALLADAKGPGQCLGANVGGLHVGEPDMTLSSFFFDFRRTSIKTGARRPSLL
jgi:hypothetical protein